MANDDTELMELRLFLEEVCCDLCRFHHVSESSIPPEYVRIRQEVDLGIPGAFADIQVRVPGAGPYFVEVKWGYDADRLVEQVTRKYSTLMPASRDATKIIVVADTEVCPNWPEVEAKLRSKLYDGFGLEVWGPDTLRTALSKRFRVDIDRLDKEHLLDVRAAVDKMKGAFAFGDAFTNSTLQSSLMWHFSFWDLRRLEEIRRDTGGSIVPPRLYHQVVVVIADLSAFSSYVRDTPDESVVRHVLTSFYSKARRQVTNSRGMFYQFVGDAVIAIFGVPESWSSYAEDAMECATALLDIGSSISHEWQRRIDRVQSTGGCHIGIAVGDLHVVPLRPCSRAHMGVVADAVNIAARLANEAQASEIVASNAFFQRLSKKSQRRFREMEPIEAHNVGRLRAWKSSFAGSS